jgi:hypothetical protein
MSGSMGERGIPPTPLRQDSREPRRWRRQWLMAAGYDELAAHRLARQGDTDVHALLVRREGDGPPADEQPRRRHG